MVLIVQSLRLVHWPGRARNDGIVTPPLNKAALHEAGHFYPGHTELLAEQFGVKDYSLVLSAGNLYFFHLTTHVSMRQAIAQITPERTGAVINLGGCLSCTAGRSHCTGRT